ncbi:hypothetical protein MRX96_040599 [Rhipicephalus microplus]
MRAKGDRASWWWEQKQQGPAWSLLTASVEEERDLAVGAGDVDPTNCPWSMSSATFRGGEAPIDVFLVLHWQRASPVRFFPPVLRIGPWVAPVAPAGLRLERSP